MGALGRWRDEGVCYYRTFLEGRVRNVVIPYLIVSTPAIAVYVFGHKTHPHVDLS